MKRSWVLGAMYVWYGLSVGFVVTLSLILYNFFNDPLTKVYLTAVAITIIVVTPILFRYGRFMMQYWFARVAFNPKCRP